MPTERGIEGMEGERRWEEGGINDRADSSGI